jgi:hypothetical protein
MPNLKPLDASLAYEIHRYTDMVAGEILRHTPVAPDGFRDPMRTEIFTGSTVMATNQGPFTITFEIDAKTLSEAFEMWLGALEDKIKELESNATKQRILNGSSLSPSQAKLAKRN